MGIKYANIFAFFLYWLIPLLIGFYIYAASKRKVALTRFADIKVLGKINISLNKSNRLLKFILYCMALAFLIFGLAGPGCNPQPRKIYRTGRDVVFMIDVSKSMLAEDLAPNRLERAKIAINDCVDVLQGDRVALVAFAGQGVVKCPLTLDYGFFRSMLNEISYQSVYRGGTNIGDALRLVLSDVFDDLSKKYKDIILITDGEDLQDSAPDFAAQEAGERGIRIIAIGLGDENTGQRIPVTDKEGRKTFMKDGEGNEVWSRLDADTLKKMANLSAGGRYLNVATDNFDLGEIYTQLIAAADRKVHESFSVQQYDEKYQIFFFIAFLLLLAEGLITLRNRRN